MLRNGPGAALVDSNNVKRVLNEGYRFLVPAPTRSYAARGGPSSRGLQIARRAASSRYRRPCGKHHRRQYNTGPPFRRLLVGESPALFQIYRARIENVCRTGLCRKDLLIDGKLDDCRNRFSIGADTEWKWIGDHLLDGDGSFIRRREVFANV